MDLPRVDKGLPESEPSPDITRWERAATSRWGRYLTAAERRMLDRACDAAGHPGIALEVGADGGRGRSFSSSVAGTSSVPM